mgnify:CR=1 FL=1
MSAGLLAGALTQGAASASVPAALTASTVQAAALFTLGKSADEAVARVEVVLKTLKKHAESLVEGSNGITEQTGKAGQVFAKQVAALGRKGDVLLAISTSGNSENIVLALQAAKEIGMTPMGLAGGTGGKMVGLADPLLVVPSTNSARIQEMHIHLGQVMCGAVERSLGLV